MNRGSTQPPRFLKISHEPAKARGLLALVGKGITFDSGGLSLKTADGMIGMKGDMGGAAAVLGALGAAPVVAPVQGRRLHPADRQHARRRRHPRRRRAPRPQRQDDRGPQHRRRGPPRARRRPVARHRGRARRHRRPRHPHRRLHGRARATAPPASWATTTAGSSRSRPRPSAADEPVWPLPLPEHIRKDLDSDIADLSNIPTGRYGGALAAGLFLEEFVGDGIPWAHLDIAGPAWGFEPHDEIPKGGTGFGVRTLARLMAGFKKPGPATAD